ncbi:MAG: hypothetical protein JWM85_3640 [Acidimicrobiaceae bacterium]|nr:hypothetical protein [Acidimicrobiaceae bacterium]
MAPRTRDYFTKRYGPVDGEKRFNEYVSKDSAPDDPLENYQGGESFADEHKPKATAGPTSTGKVNLTEVQRSIAGALGIANKGLLMLYPPWVEDQLQAQEIGQLAIALGDEVMQSKTLQKWFLSARTNNVHVKLGWTLAFIMVPRLQRRGILPAFSLNPDDYTGANGATVPMERGGTPGTDWDNGFGEVNAGESFADRTEVYNSSQEQSGQDQVRQDNNSGDVPRPGRPKTFKDRIIPILQESGV